MTKEQKGFWYNLGLEVGGPLYLDLYRWLFEKTAQEGKRVYFLAPGGYNLYRIFEKQGVKNISYLSLAQDLLKSAVDGDCRAKEEMLQYLEENQFLQQDSLCFEWGWQGTIQALLEQFKGIIGNQSKQFFLYYGIENSDVSRAQVRGMHYDTYLFDFYKNYSLQADAAQNKAVYELFFADTSECAELQELFNGICAFLQEKLPLAERDTVGCNGELSVVPLKRLIHFPTAEEATVIGDFLQDKECWVQGFLKRADVFEDDKCAYAEKLGVEYPKKEQVYHLEDERSIRSYQRWMRLQAKETDVRKELSYKPFFSVVIPVYNTITEQLEECINSVLGQSYDQYELILVDDHSSWDNVVPVLRKYEADPHVKVIYRETNGHISIATNDGISAAKGEFIVFMDCDDMIEPHALYEFAQKLNENPELDFIYSDEDKITEDGKIKHMPFFKPDWSPDLFLSMMYTNHLATYRASIVKEVGGLRTAYNGSQDYDMTLRFMEKSDNTRVGHIPKILYHWRERKESVAYAVSSKNYATDAARYAKEDYIKRNQIKAHLEYITGISQYRIVYEVTGSPKVSIVIPSKDHPEILKQCVDSIRKYTSYKNYEIIVVDNGSSESNKNAIGEYLGAAGAKYLYEPMEFNFSRMCNMGAGNAGGEYLLFLNDDIEIIQPDWLERMLGHAQQKHVGAVGAKLFYPLSTKIQHGGVSNRIDGPTHNFLLQEDHAPHYFSLNWVNYDCLAVTGACLLLSCDKFKTIGGFDEKLSVAYNDVKLCMELHKLGYYNVIRNDVVAYHHESLSRGSDFQNESKLIRVNKERCELFAEFSELYGRDPFLNPHLREMGAPLSLKCDYNTFTECDLSDCEMAEYAVIDQVHVGEQVCIVGWSLLAGEEHMEELERYIVFVDPHGKTYQADVIPSARVDVAENLGNDNYQYAGFECILRRSDLRIELFEYRLGVLTIDRTGKRHLGWSIETNLIKMPKAIPFALENRDLGVWEQHSPQVGVQWYVDECQHYESHHKISGFAYKCGDDHYLYRKTLVLVDREGNAREFDVQLNERLDVAYTFPREHFLYYTGFTCYIFDSVLEQGQEYDVIIRLKHQFNTDEILDIVTGQKVSVL